MEDWIRAVYRVRSRQSGSEIAREIVNRQTGWAPLPRRGNSIPAGSGHRAVIHRIEPGRHSGEYFIEIHYPAANTEGDLATLLNLVFGEVSIMGHCRLESLALPPGYGFTPRWGGRGLRERCAVKGRPLVMAILKPAWGLEFTERVRRIRELGAAGVDIIKEDEIFTGGDLDRRWERIARIREVVDEVGHRRGRPMLYIPVLTGAGRSMLERAREYENAGAHGVLVNLGPSGFSVLDALAQAEGLNLVVMVHPSMTGPFYLNGRTGIRARCLFGHILAHSGADAVLYPSHYGRYPMPREEEAAVRDALRSRGVMPVPGGGLDPERLLRILRMYGRELIINLGGYLHAAGPDLDAAVRRIFQVCEKFGGGPGGSLD